MTEDWYYKADIHRREAEVTAQFVPGGAGLTASTRRRGFWYARSPLRAPRSSSPWMTGAWTTTGRRRPSAASPCSRLRTCRSGCLRSRFLTCSVVAGDTSWGTTARPTVNCAQPGSFLRCSTQMYALSGPGDGTHARQVLRGDLVAARSHRDFSDCRGGWGLRSPPSTGPPGVWRRCRTGSHTSWDRRAGCCRLDGGSGSIPAPASYSASRWSTCPRRCSRYGSG
jgi:hypothetical protein